MNERLNIILWKNWKFPLDKDKEIKSKLSGFWKENKFKNFTWQNVLKITHSHFTHSD